MNYEIFDFKPELLTLFKHNVIKTKTNKNVFIKTYSLDRNSFYFYNDLNKQTNANNLLSYDELKSNIIQDINLFESYNLSHFKFILIIPVQLVDFHANYNNCIVIDSTYSYDLVKNECSKHVGNHNIKNLADVYVQDIFEKTKEYLLNISFENLTLEYMNSNNGIKLNIQEKKNNNEITLYSQNINGFMIDKFIIENYILNKNIKNGTFLEVGGFDGVTYSNTMALEKYFNFTGILIEASPKSFEKLKQNRPHTKNYQLALDSKPGLVSFIGDDSAVAGIDNYMNEDKKKCWQKEGQGNLPINGDTYLVRANTIGNVINESGFKYIDFCFIDVEGGELEVIKGMDWNIPVFMFVIEMTGHSSSNPNYLQETHNILKNKGYKLILKDGYNDEFWINLNCPRCNMFI